MELELVSTDDLIEELRRRSKVFFCCMRPIVDEKDFDWRVCWGSAERQPEEFARTLGLIELAKFDLLRRQDEEERDSNG